SLSADRADDVGEGPSVSSVDVREITIGIHKDQRTIHIRPKLLLSAFTQSEDGTPGQPVVSIEAIFVLVYTCHDLDRIPRENLDAFANTNALFHVWPYWRELVMTTTARMRIEPIVIPVFRFDSESYRETDPAKP